MTTDLYMLAYSGLLAMLIPVIAIAGRFQADPKLKWGLGNRETELAGQPAWAERTARAHRNLLENLPVFAIFVLTAQVAGLANETTALGATLFFYGRIAHVITYIAGLVPWRTLAFAVAVTGELIILSEILGGR
ncbi:MAG: MAPEG family protein [Deltaproteobacteria bacterium]